MEPSGSEDQTSLDNEKKDSEDKIEVETVTASSPPSTVRAGSPRITVTGDGAASGPLKTAVAPRQRKRSQPVRGELLPDPDKLLRYKHHDKKEEEDLEDPTFPGGHPKPPPEPRAPGQPAVRKRSNVTFCPVVVEIEK